MSRHNLFMKLVERRDQQAWKVRYHIDRIDEVVDDWVVMFGESEEEVTKRFYELTGAFVTIRGIGKLG